MLIAALFAVFAVNVTLLVVVPPETDNLESRFACSPVTVEIACVPV